MSEGTQSSKPEMSKSQDAETVPDLPDEQYTPPSWLQWTLIVDKTWFEATIIGVIFVTCMQLALYDPYDEDDDSTHSQIDKYIDAICLAIFTCELLLKHAAYGIRGYWSGGWNRLDALVVVTGFISLAPGMDSLVIMRLLRVLRPLRIVNKLHGMKAIIQTLVSSAKPLADTALLVCALMFVFGIVGVTLFQGYTRQQCYTLSAGEYTLNEDVSRHCGGKYDCPDGDVCTYSRTGPNFSLTSFDHISVAFLTIFCAVTLEGWVDTMYIMQDAYGYWVATIFFHLLIIFGSIFVLELALAVLAESFDSNLEDKDEDEEADAAPSENSEHEYVGAHQTGYDEAASKTIAEHREDRKRENALKEEERKAAADVPEPPTNGFLKMCFDISISQTLSNIIIAFILLNTATLCVEHKRSEKINGVEQATEMDSGLKDVLDVCNYVFIAVFTLEAAVKLLGLGPRFYFRDTFNQFDFVVVLFSYLEIILAGGGAFSALRTFRLMRIMKLTKRWRSMRVVLTTVLDTLPQMSYLMMLAGLFIFMAAVAGMQLFGGKLTTTHGLEEDPRSNFDNFGVAVLTVFQILTGENWNEVMYNSMEVTSLWSVIYFLIVVIVGTYIILNLTLAILLSNFAVAEPEDDGDGGGVMDSMKQLFMSCCKRGPSEAVVTPEEAEGEGGKSDTIPVETIDCPPPEAQAQADNATQSPSGRTSPNSTSRALLLPPIDHPLPGTPGPSDSAQPQGSGSGLAAEEESVAQAAADLTEEAVLAKKVKPLMDHLELSKGIANFRSNWRVETHDGDDISVMAESVSEGLRLQKKKEEALEAAQDKDCCGIALPEPEELTGVSLWLFAPENKIRTALHKLVRHPIFDNVILALITISSITLAMDGPTLDSDSDLASALEILDIVFTTIFVIEMCMKIIVYGFILDKNAYLLDPWNQLDFFIVIISLLSVTGALSSGGLRALRTLRALRPLRTIKRAPGLRIAVETIIRCLPPFINISIVTGVCYLIFAIMGVQFWSGKFWKCSVEDVANVTECTAQGGDWLNAPLNFDNTLNGMLTLFEVASLELWLDVMHNAMDAPSEIGEQPTQNHRWWAAVYFVIFIIIGSFLVMNLFVGAVVDTFNEVKNEQERSAMMSESQAQFVASMRELFNNAPEPTPLPPDQVRTVAAVSAIDRKAKEEAPSRSFVMSSRVACFRLVTFEKGALSFDNIIAALIGVNIIVMALNWWEIPALGVAAESDAVKDLQKTDFNEALEKANLAFTIVFALEAILKMAGLGFEQYFMNLLNRFDLMVVIVSVIGTIIDYAATDPNDTLVSVLLVFRVCRVLRIFRLALRFAGIKRLLRTLLFTLPSVMNVLALLTLVIFIFTVLGMSFFGNNRFATVEDHAHYALYNDHANFRYFHIGFFALFRMCTGESWNAIMHDVMDANGGIASLFFVSYMIIASYLLLSLVIAIMLEEFTATARADKFKISPDDLEQFTNVWAVYDPAADLTIPMGKLASFLIDVGQPLGVNEVEGRTKANLIAIQLGCPIVDGRYHFTEVFSACARRALRVETLDSQILADVMTSLTTTNQNLAPMVKE